MVTYVLLALVGLSVLYYALRYIHEILNPFEHRDVPLQGVPGHVRELCRRGFPGTEMTIADQAGGRIIKLRRCRRRGENRLYVTVSLPLAEERVDRSTIAGLQAAYQGTSWRIAECQKGSRSVAVELQPGEEEETSDLAGSIVVRLIGDVMELPATARFGVWVKGQISPYDDYFSLNSRFFPPLEGNLGIPYKWWQAEPGRVRQLGRVLGSIMRVLTAPFRRR